MRLYIIVLFLLTGTCFGQTYLKPEIQTLESKIKLLEKEILLLESQKNQKLNDQQLLIDEKQKQENNQQLVVDRINKKIMNLKTKLSNYAVNQNQILAYKELSDKELYVEHLQDKRLIKFKEIIKESNTIAYSDYREVYSSNAIYILNNNGKSKFQKIEFLEKQHKQFNKLLEKEILLPVGGVKASYLKEETGLDEQYFLLFDKKNNQETLLKKELSKLNKLKSHKQKLVRSKDEFAKTFNNQITNNNLEISKLDKEIKSIIQADKFNKSVEKCSIGNQVWMSTNLDITNFRNGDNIMQAQSRNDWVNALFQKEPAWCYPEGCTEKCGKIYNYWAVIDQRGLAPLGWHIPSKEECLILGKFNGGFKSQEIRSNSGWEPYSGWEKCSNCINWSDSYRNDVPCHKYGLMGCCKCKNKKSIRTPTIKTNGNNKLGLNLKNCPIRYPEWNLEQFIVRDYWGEIVIPLTYNVDYNISGSDGFDFKSVNSGCFWTSTIVNQSEPYSSHNYNYGVRFSQFNGDPTHYNEREGYPFYDYFKVYTFSIFAGHINISTEDLSLVDRSHFSGGSYVRCIKD